MSDEERPLGLIQSLFARIVAAAMALAGALIAGILRAFLGGPREEPEE